MKVEQIPSVLEKAIEDVFSYALKLRSGDVFEFTSATIYNPGFAVLHNAYFVTSQDNSKSGIQLSPERGVEVRISDIVWIIDAPHGS